MLLMKKTRRLLVPDRSKVTQSDSRNGRSVMTNETAKPPKRLNKQEARESLPEALRVTFDKLCEETLHWSKYYYCANFISYSILKELVQDGWTKQEEQKP